MTLPRSYSIMMEGYIQFGGLWLSQTFARNLDWAQEQLLFYRHELNILGFEDPRGVENGHRDVCTYDKENGQVQST